MQTTGVLLASTLPHWVIKFTCQYARTRSYLVNVAQRADDSFPYNGI